MIPLVPSLHISLCMGLIRLLMLISPRLRLRSPVAWVRAFGIRRPAFPAIEGYLAALPPLAGHLAGSLRHWAARPAFPAGDGYLVPAFAPGRLAESVRNGTAPSVYGYLARLTRLRTALQRHGFDFSLSGYLAFRAWLRATYISYHASGGIFAALAAMISPHCFALKNTSLRLVCTAPI